MKRLQTVICILLILVVFYAAFYYCCNLPLRTDELASEKYEGWSGVLRVWFYDSLKSGQGSVSGWLNGCSASFEKNFEGIYIQIQQVDSSAIKGLFENGVIPPDMIVFPSGVIEKPSHLIPLKESRQVLSDLSYSGAYNGIVYAQPIALGGYCWVYNTDILNSIPSTWERTNSVITSLPDSALNNWSSALAALCSGRYSLYYEDTVPETSSFDIDLGLSLYQITPEPVSTPQPQTENLLYCNLPENFFFSQTAFTDFVNGSISAMPASQYEIRRLSDLSDQGKGPAWRTSVSGDISFSDQVIYASVVDKSDSPEKQAVCQSFINYILSDECQQDVHRAGMFSSTGADSGYDSHDPLKTIEKSLTDKPLYAFGAFDASDNEYFSSIVRKFLDQSGFSQDLYETLMNLLL